LHLQPPPPHTLPDSEPKAYRFKYLKEITDAAALMTSTKCIQRKMAVDAMLYVRSGIQAALRAKVKEAKKNAKEKPKMAEDARAAFQRASMEVEWIKEEIQRILQRDRNNQAVDDEERKTLHKTKEIAS
jgi:hypothetical protein